MRRTILILAATLIVAGCGGDRPVAFRDGAVVYSDPLDDNRGGWHENLAGGVFFDNGRYQWWNVPLAHAASAPDALLFERQIPPGLALGATVEQRSGAALRGLACREVGPRDEPPRAWYELAIDGRQAMIRRMAEKAAPRVLARADLDVPNGRPTRLLAHCVPAADGVLELALNVDGREVVRARDSDPLPAVSDGVEASPSLRMYRRPDSPGRAILAWDDFEVRTATIVD